MEVLETAYLACMAASMITPDHVQALFDRYESGEKVFYAIKNNDHSILEILPLSILQKISHMMDTDRVHYYSGLINKHHIYGIKCSDPCFPEILRQIPNPVSILFYQGNINCLQNRMLSMVGSRSASYAGLKAASKIAEDLSRSSVTIVSGFAYGIDTASHVGCIKGGSPTIAVMGCGLDQNYPADNALLRKKVIENGGLILSEYSPGEKPLAAHFPYRNRIISALGEALILMEAKIRSGSMTSVSHALEQGKEVFVYPGDPSSPHFEGNHQLLREGATYFTSAKDILEDMKWLDNPVFQVQNNECSAKGLNPAEKAVYTALQRETMSFDQLSSHTGLSPSELMSALTIMQVRGDIEPLPGKLYRIRQ